MAGRTCRICGAAVPPTFQGDRSPNRYRCCSVECQRTHWRLKSQERDGTATKTDKPCAMCGNPTGVQPSGGRDRKYCSKSCAEKYRYHLNPASAYVPVTESAIVVLDCVDCATPHVTQPHIGRRRCPTCHADHLRHKARSSAARYRARKRNARVEVFSNVEVYDRDGWCCGPCGKRINRTLVFPHPKSVSLDHVIPLSRGGEHSMANTQASHLDCNLRKNAGSIAPEQLRLIG